VMDAGRGMPIGVDVGGTHTDVVVQVGDRVARGKALTTYGDYSDGLFAAIGVAADALGIDVTDLIARRRS
jgi:N-methylhydantoinase A